VKEKFNQLFKDKLFLVMLVLGLLTIVAAAGAVTIQRGNIAEENPYMQMKEPDALIAEDSQELPTQVAGNANAQKEDPAKTPDGQKTDSTKTGGQNGSQTGADSGTKTEIAKNSGEEKSDAQAAQVGAGQNAAVPLVLDFTDTSRIAWPVMGNILLDYSMDSTIYFPTLDQYQCNPGVVIQAEVSQPVVSPANARVVAVSADEELGNYVVLDLGNDYVATCGQLKEIQVAENEYLEAGQLLGYVAEPTKYYSVEGSNVFFELQHDGKAIDPLGYFE